MKLIKLTLSILSIACFFLFSCEKETENYDEQTVLKNSSIEKEEKEIDFSLMETIVEDGILQEFEEGLMENIDKFNNLQELDEIVGDYKRDLQSINQFLKYKGKQEIDLDAYYNKGMAFINDENASVEEFSSFLSSTGIYNDIQLKHFIVLDKEMSQNLSKDEYLAAVEKFKNNIQNEEELSKFDKNTMLLYASMVNVFVHSNHFDAMKSKCSDCLRRNGWRIFGWGALYWLITLIPCFFTGPGFIACLIVTAGFWALNSIKMVCGWAGCL